MGKLLVRSELEEALEDHGWKLFYGRRKTGKTFYVRNRADYDAYFIVSNDRTVTDVETGEMYSPQEFLRLVARMLGGYSIVVDEFHRLGEAFMSLLQGRSGEGDLILITSTRDFFWRIIKGPLLGLFEMYEVGLVKPEDIYKHVGLDIERLILFQEPTTINMSNPLAQSRYLAKLILTEAFQEERRDLTERYFGILTALGEGYNRVGNIASFLSGKFQGITTSLVSKYLAELEKLGFVVSRKIWDGKGKFYRHLSPLLDFAFYMNSRYGFFENEVERKLLNSVWKDRMGIYLEWTLERVISSMGYLPVKIIKEPVDLAFTDPKGKTLEIVAEVKLGDISGDELKRAEERLFRIKAKRRILIVGGEVPRKTNLDVISLKSIFEDNLFNTVKQ